MSGPVSETLLLGGGGNESPAGEWTAAREHRRSAPAPFESTQAFPGNRGHLRFLCKRMTPG